MSKNEIIGATVCAMAGMNKEFVGLVRDIANRLSKTDSQASAWHGYISHAIQQGLPNVKGEEKRPAPQTATRTPILLLSGDTKLTLPATSGVRTIAQSKKVFAGYIDADFTKRELDVPSSPKPATPTAVYKMVRDADFATMLADNPLRFTQDQIITFVEHFPQWLHPTGWGTFLPFTVGDKDFVAGVYRYSGGRLEVCVYGFASDNVWNAEGRYRVVIPQLETQFT